MTSSSAALLGVLGLEGPRYIASTSPRKVLTDSGHGYRNTMVAGLAMALSSMKLSTIPSGFGRYCFTLVGHGGAIDRSTTAGDVVVIEV